MKKINPSDILIRPVMTEKSLTGEAQGQYTFFVSPTANKVEIKEAIRELYGVMPARVRVLHVEGKRVRFGRSMGRRNDTKKAIVVLPKGTTISIHEGV
jgi:large subunit ribosomal protein L23